ncbi:MAG: hypothetical protein ACXABY_07805 [Candidatus Thorarchaeota archaeon]|jgi:hypothetical protein
MSDLPKAEDVLSDDELLEIMKDSEIFPRTIDLPEDQHTVLDELHKKMKTANLALTLAQEEYAQAQGALWDFITHLIADKTISYDTATYMQDEHKLILNAPTYSQLQNQCRLLKGLLVRDKHYSMASEVRSMEKLVHDFRTLMEHRGNELSFLRELIDKSGEGAEGMEAAEKTLRTLTAMFQQAKDGGTA